VNHHDGGQRERVRLALVKGFNQGQDGAGLVLGKEKPGAGGSRNRRLNMYRMHPQ
jgi:hypothetical protein